MIRKSHPTDRVEKDGKRSNDEMTDGFSPTGLRVFLHFRVTTMTFGKGEAFWTVNDINRTKDGVFGSWRWSS